ncbi:hypothetical protein SDC9_106563 [bioreactor metagenome]|uniref:Uncharacterized protein n=1 Tax=bioreactor metagenome TaxID=1076179 RepID=A0A645B2U8_9ZZZZ
MLRQQAEAVRALAHHHEAPLQCAQIAGPQQIGQGRAHQGQRNVVHPVVMHKTLAQAAHGERQAVLPFLLATPHETIDPERLQQPLDGGAVHAAGLRQRRRGCHATGCAIERLQHSQAARQTAHFLVVMVRK